MNFVLFFLFHAVYSTLCSYLLSLAFGQLNFTISLIGIVMGTLLALRHSRSFQGLPQPSKGGVELTLFVILIYAGIRHFMWLLFPMDKGLATLSANNFGDLPLHINYIRQFAAGADFPAINPSFALEKLRYPLGSDFYNALWEAVGLRTEAHLFITGLAFTIVSLYLLHSFGGWWAIGGFFFNGGWLGFMMAINGELQDRQQNIEWKSIFLSVFITQRGVLFALPMGLLLLISTIRHYSAEAPMTGKQKTALGVIWGFLPLFHLHSFVAVSLLMALVAFRYRRLSGLRELLMSKVALLAYLPAFLFVMFSTNWLQKSSIAHWSVGWMAQKGQVASFVWNNFGLWLLVPVMIALGIFFSKTHTREQKKGLWIEFAGTSLLFLLFFNFMLAPWAWDNIKVLIWPYLMFLRLSYLVLEPYLLKLDDDLGGFLKPLVAAALLLPGLSSVYSSMRSPNQTGVHVYSISEIANTEGAIDSIEGLNPNTVFAAAPTHNHPLTYFGKLRVVGYEGHLWSHGINATETVQKLRSLLQGEEGWREKAKGLGVSYIFWGPQERQMFGEDERAWMKELENVSRVPGFAIYAIK